MANKDVEKLYDRLRRVEILLAVNTTLVLLLMHRDISAVFAFIGGQ